jgi:hypothetical protein
MKKLVCTLLVAVCCLSFLCAFQGYAGGSLSGIIDVRHYVVPSVSNFGATTVWLGQEIRGLNYFGNGDHWGVGYEAGLTEAIASNSYEGEGNIGLQGKVIPYGLVEGLYKQQIFDKAEYQLGVGLEFGKIMLSVSTSVLYHISSAICFETGLRMKFGLSPDRKYYTTTTDTTTAENKFTAGFQPYIGLLWQYK